MNVEIKNTGDAGTTSTSSEQQELTLHRDAELAANLMLDAESTRLANLSHENKILVANGLTEKLKKAHREHDLDVAGLRHKLELSQEVEKEESHEL